MLKYAYSVVEHHEAVLALPLVDLLVAHVEIAEDPLRRDLHADGLDDGAQLDRMLRSRQ